MRIIGSDAIDIGQPVNWDNPLTAGLYLMWHALPGMGKQSIPDGSQAITWGMECLTKSRVRSPGYGMGMGSIKATRYGARYWTGNSSTSSFEVSIPETPIVSPNTVAHQQEGFGSAAVLFTTDALGPYYRLIENLNGTMTFRILTSGVVGNPLTGMWNANVAGEYDATTSLYIPTDGSICLGCVSVTATAITIHLVTDTFAKTYVISKTAAPKEFGATWSFGSPQQIASKTWQGTIGPFWVWKNRPITLNDCISLKADPWQTFTILSPTATFFVSSPASTTYECTADATATVSSAGGPTLTYAGTTDATATVSSAGGPTLTYAGTTDATATVSSDGGPTLTYPCTADSEADVGGIGAPTETYECTADATATVSSAGGPTLTYAGTTDATATVSSAGGPTLTYAGTTDATAIVSGAADTGAAAHIGLTVVSLSVDSSSVLDLEVGSSEKASLVVRTSTQ